MPSNPAPITDQDLDRLADGELTASEQRDLLAALETSPDGWRRCALAYIESQTLRREMRGLVTQAPAPRPTAHDTRTSKSVTGRVNGWLAIAATVLLAFTAGMLSQRMNAAPAPSPKELAVAPETPIGPNADQLANAPLQRVDRPDPDVVTFWTRDDDGQRQSLRAKLVEAEEMDRRLGVEFHSAVPAEVRQRLEQRGYRLDSRKRFAPLNMDDGRVLVVPVEDMQVQPVPVQYL